MNATSGHQVPKDLQALVTRVAGFDLELSFRPMFGGIMAYAAGRPFASLSNRGVAIKLDGPALVELRSVEGAEPLRYEAHDPPSRSYTVLPATMLEDADLMRAWLERSAAAVAAAPTRSPRRRARSPKR